MGIVYWWKVEGGTWKVERGTWKVERGTEFGDGNRSTGYLSTMNYELPLLL